MQPTTQFIRPMAPRAACKPFKTSHAEQIKLVSSFDWLDLSKFNSLGDESRAICEVIISLYDLCLIRNPYFFIDGFAVTVQLWA